MGTMISFFRRPEMDTTAQLSSIETKLKSWNETASLNQSRLDKLTKNTLFYGILLGLLLIGCVYVLFPPEIIKRVILLVFLFAIYPVAVLLIRKFLKYCFTRKKDEAVKSVSRLKKEKEEILENVMEKEPYNKAREILKKFAPNHAQLDKQTPRDGQKVRQKLVDGKPINQTVSTPINKTISGVENIPPGNPRYSRQVRPVANATFSGGLHRSPIKRAVKTVRPLPNQLNQSKVDKIVGWVVGSNPEQMYALICRSCCSHNGLAIREEFVYLDWKCAFCHEHNPAKKERPRPPRLEEQKPMDRPRSLGSSRTPSADRTSSQPSQSSPTPAASSVRRDSVDKKEDSGTESDQMEKHDESSVLEESIIGGSPDIAPNNEEEEEENTTIEQEMDSDPDGSVKQVKEEPEQIEQSEL